MSRASLTACRRAAVLVVTMLVVTALGGACDTDDHTGVPQPDPLPLVSAMRATQSGDQAQPVRIVGLPGAVAGAGKVTATIAGKQVTESTSTAAGSFTLEVLAAGEQVVELRYERSAAAALKIAHVCPGGVTCNQPPPPPGPRAGVAPVEAPVDGKVVVRGQAGGELSGVVIANADNGDAREAKVGAGGVFDTEITASSGDALLVFHMSGAELEPPWELTVP